jgi:hypothetical protein
MDTAGHPMRSETTHVMCHVLLARLRHPASTYALCCMFDVVELRYELK